MMQAALHPARVPALAIVAAIVLAVGFAAPRPASAGEYTISVCQADEAGYVSSAFEQFATRGMKWRRACDPRGDGLRGLVTANVPRAGRVEQGAQSGFILNAPPETTFSRLRWSGQAQRRDCRYSLQLFAERPGTTPVSMKNVRANRGCPRPGLAQSSGAPFPRAYDLGGATRIVQRVVCLGSPKYQFCSARGQNYIRTFSAEATVVDGSPPAVGVVQDSAFTQGQWVRGTQRFGYDASDNVGVKSASALISGGVRATEPRSCDYSQRIPCPNGGGPIAVNTAEAPEGSQPLTVAAEDAAGNRAESGAVTVRIDNAAPGAVPVAVGGGETWRNANDFDVAWANPSEGDRAPITAAHFRLCRAGGNDCINGDRAGAGIAAIDNLAVPSPGEWELRLWREDSAGNQQADNASQPVRLRFDPEPPQLGFENPTAEDPTRVSVLVTDRISGLAGGGIEISRAGSGSWQVLPTTQDGDHLVTQIDDASLPPGDYELRATAHDQANNLAGTDRRLDGQPMRLKLPLRIATAMKAGVVEKRSVTRKGKKGKVRRTVLEPRTTVSFGSKVHLGGRLVNGAGHPLADAKVLVYSRLKEGTEQLAGSVTTDANGRFSYAVEARASHSFRFAYPGTATILPIEDTATLLVKGTSTFTVKPKRVQNGGSVTFTGRVKGRPLPEAGKLLELQVRFTSGWQTFRTINTEADGTWRIPYLFDRTCGEQAFDFRAHLAGEAGWPLEAGNSRTLTVRVKGQPC
jgi:5-hydroxyisourate hydrolase-like protein (transthyretin family)